MLPYSLSDVNKMFTKEKKENYEMGEEDLNPYKISISNPVDFCLNCNNKIKGNNHFCDKDCESTYRIKQNIKDILIPKLEEEIHILKQQDIPININYKTNYEKQENLIKGKEMLLEKYKKEAGLTNINLPPNAIPIPILKKGGKKTKKSKKLKKLKKTKKRKWSQKYKKVKKTIL
jgi:hypothetical protein